MSDDERKPSASPEPDARSESSGPDDVEPVKKTKKTKKRPRAYDPDEEEEDAGEDVKVDDGDEDGEDESSGRGNGGGDDDDDEEEEEDDEDEDEEDGDERRQHKRRRKQKNRNRFLDIEAEVDDEDEDEADDDDFADVAEFINEGPEEALGRDDLEHRRLDRRRDGAEAQEDVEETVRRLRERYSRQTVRYNPDSDHVPQRLLMPGVNDPSLYQVKCKTGQEKELIRKIFNKVEQTQFSGNAPEIYSAFSRDVLPGVILIEASTQAAVTQVLMGLVGVFMSTPPKLVPIEEMSAMLRIKSFQEDKFSIFQWVRLGRGKYAGDLAQVIDIAGLTDGKLGLKVIPRIDLTPRESRNKDKAGKALGGSIRPPARLFDPDEVKKIYGRSAVRPTPSADDGSFEFDGDEYEHGFLVKDFKLATIQAKDVKPTLEEVTQFAGDDAGAAELDLLAIQEANNTSTADFSVGDKVEVSKGELAGLVGRVSAISAAVIAIRQDTDGTLGSLVEVATDDVRKRFDVGEHVKVLRGKNKDASGMVVDVKGEVVTIMSDQGEQEIKAFSKDVRKAADAAGSEQTRGIYDLHDMVMLDSTTAAVIVKIEGAMLRIIDQNGLVKVVSPQEVTPRRDNKNFAVATDGHGNDMKIGDAMKEMAGEGRTGEVINIFRSIFIFLFNRDISENYGVFVARHSALVSVTPKAAAGGDLSKMHPSLQGALPGGGAALMPPPQVVPNKSRLVNELVVVVKGTHKGLMGIIKDIQGDKARVEMATNNKVLTLDLTSLKKKDPRTGMTSALEMPGAGMGGYGGPGGYNMAAGYGAPPMNGGATPNPYGNGAMGNPYAPGKTPNPYAGGRTPAPNAWAAGGKTPAPGAWASGGKTPAPGAWASGGKTPAPGAWGSGGKTPAPGWAGGRTPAPGGGFDGGRTPGWAGGGGGGGKTPNPYAGAGGRTPAPHSSSYGQMPSSSMSAPSPYGGPPTAPPAAAPTPGVYSAPTPYGGAPTPYSGPPGYTAPTPGAGLSAPTPGAGLGGGSILGAPTPYGSAPTPYAAGGPGGAASSSDLPWDWALDFRNVIVEIGPSSKVGSKVRHFVRGQYDGQHFGYSEPASEAAGLETCKCTLLSDESITEEIPAEYIRPLRPTAPNQVVVVIQGDHGKGSQHTTQYRDEDAWAMQSTSGEIPAVLYSKDLCRIWKADA